MLSCEDLFEYRDVLGKKLEETMAQKNYTKSRLSNYSGVSRPTLDKVFEGTIPSRSTYAKHMDKILSALDISADTLLGRRVCSIKNMTMRIVRKDMFMSLEALSEKTGISISDLELIEDGATPTLVQMRDIAWALKTSTSIFNGGSPFSTQIAIPDSSLSNDGSIYGHWGYIGIQTTNDSKHEICWHPITYDALQSARISLERGQQQISIPCLNNTLLLINCNNVRNLLFAKNNNDIVPRVIRKEQLIPPVVYEAMDDYLAYLNFGPHISSAIDPYDHTNTLSDLLIKSMGELYAHLKWEPTKKIMDSVSLKAHYKDGAIKDMMFSPFRKNKRKGERFPSDTAISFAECVVESYCLGCNSLQPGHNYIRLLRSDGAECFINLSEISHIELPLAFMEPEVSALLQKTKHH